METESKNPEEGFFCVKAIRSKKGDLHFKRWRFIETPWFNIYLHKICASDKDKDPHDHPWPYRTIILKGIYKERSYRVYEDMSSGTPIKKFLPVQEHIYRPGDSVSHEWYDAHKIEIIKGPVWTLVITGKHRGNWGYVTNDGWKDHLTYRQEKNGGADVKRVEASGSCETTQGGSSLPDQPHNPDEQRT